MKFVWSWDSIFKTFKLTWIWERVYLVARSKSYRRWNSWSWPLKRNKFSPWFRWSKKVSSDFSRKEMRNLRRRGSRLGLKRLLPWRCFRIRLVRVEAGRPLKKEKLLLRGRSKKMSACKLKLSNRILLKNWKNSTCCWFRMRTKLLEILETLMLKTRISWIVSLKNWFRRDKRRKNRFKMRFKSLKSLK